MWFEEEDDATQYSHEYLNEISKLISQSSVIKALLDKLLSYLSGLVDQATFS